MSESNLPGWWIALSGEIQDQRLLPVISDSLARSRIFACDDNGQLGVNLDPEQVTPRRQLALEQQLAFEYARRIRYPLDEGAFELGRIVQYHQFTESSAAKDYYLTFLKHFLLTLATQDSAVAETAKERLRAVQDPSLEQMTLNFGKETFSEIAGELGYPKYASQDENPLHLLADLPVPIYLTTSHHDFLERELRKLDKYPRVDVCSPLGRHRRPRWFDSPPPAGGDLDADPVENTPTVYHLYGLESEPASMVVSEDDYMCFLISVSEDRKAVVPDLLSEALADSSILLLGYRLQSWEFRVLMQGILRRAQQKSKRIDRPNLAIQLDPPLCELGTDPQDQTECLEDAKRYLRSYLAISGLKVEFCSTLESVRAIWNAYQKRYR